MIGHEVTRSVLAQQIASFIVVNSFGENFPNDRGSGEKLLAVSPGKSLPLA